MPCCPLSNAFEAANGTESENGTDRQTDGRTDRCSTKCSPPQGGGIITQRRRTNSSAEFWDERPSSQV